jgi:hypothetical protein
VPVDDPKDLEQADREIRINELRESARELSGGEMTSFENDEPPSEVREVFWENVVRFEQGPFSSPFAEMEKDGVALPNPDELDDGRVHAKLWEILRWLESHDGYVSNTDHLSDRELYQQLWHDVLREEGPVFPPGSGWRQHFDMIGSGSEEDCEIHYRYYADDESRAHWAAEFPDFVMPPREKPPFDRDRLLPRCTDHCCKGEPLEDDRDESSGDE